MRVFATILLLSCTFAYGQTLKIDEAILENIKYISDKFASGTKVVVFNIESEHKKLSDYIIGKNNAFITNNTKLSLISKSELSSILQKKNIKNLDKIDEATTLNIARELGATEVIFGSISKFGEIYRFRVYALGATYGEVRGTQTLLVEEDKILANLIGTGAAFAAKNAKKTPQTFAEKRDAEFDDLSKLRASGGFIDSQSAKDKLEAETNANTSQISQISQNQQISQISTDSLSNANKQTKSQSKKNADKSRFLISFKPQIYNVNFPSETVKIPAASLEVGGITVNGFRCNAILDVGKSNLGYGVYLGKQTKGKIFRFNGGTDLGMWEISAQSPEKTNTSAAVKQNFMFGGPRIGFMLGYNFIFLDFTMKYYIGAFAMHDTSDWSGGFWGNFSEGYDSGFSAMYLWNIGINFTF